MNRESGLANDENTKVPDYEQLPVSGEDTVVDKTTTEATDEKVPEDEQLPGSGKEIVVDETTTEIAKDEATGQGPAR